VNVHLILKITNIAMDVGGAKNAFGVLGDIHNGKKRSK
jgi:hypothetical protein